MIDLTKASRAEMLAYAHDLTVMLRLSPDWVIAVNEKGESFKVLVVPEPKTVKRSMFALRCVDLCGYNLKRPHFTCLVCGWRRLKAGKIKPVFPCDVYFLSIVKGRSLERVRAWLLKKVLAVAEVLAS